MDILEYLKQDINDEYFFFNRNSGADARKNLRTIVADFLNCDNERHRGTLAAMIINYVLLPHAKGAEAASLADVLNMFELFGQYDYTENRKHLVHQLNTFLLGLLLYKNVDTLRDHINKEMENTTDFYSSGDKKGEFLFRWRLCALCHDIGNGISLFKDDTDQINKYIFYLQLLTNEKWGEAEEGVHKLLSLDRDKNALSVLDEVGENTNMTDFFRSLKGNPVKDIYYDHGVVSALILLKLLDQMYSKLSEQTIHYKGHNVSFKRKYFDNSIVRSAYAIAVHNIDFYPDIYATIWSSERMYDSEKRPLVFLLKICDSLQEWYKAKALDETDYIEPSQIELQLDRDKIGIKKFPEKRGLVRKLDKYFNHHGLIDI